MSNTKKLSCSISLLLLLVVTFLVYRPGLNGGFIFDDYNTIPKLSVFQGEITAEKLQKYIGESTTGPLKRPISVMSFLIDSTVWPTAAYPFKRTNLIIHMINGSILFLLLYGLFQAKGLPSRTNLLVTSTAAGLWMLHPFLVSTTLYIVQRMAMLPLTFMLIGFVLYFWARRKYQASDGKKGIITLFVAVYAMTVLAALSKENGVVYLWLVTLFEFYIIRKYLNYQALGKLLQWLLLLLPCLLLILVFLVQVPEFISGYDVRLFSMGERLLTQMRALTDYISNLLMPSYFTFGVFTDGYEYSTGLFSPISTLFSTLFIGLLLGLAWFKRNQWVWFSFTVFFFFTAQILESTIVPLELYYEHRVYVASIFFGVPIALAVIKLAEHTKVFLIVPFVLLTLMAGMTFMRANIWSNNLQLHELTMQKYPESVRARVSTAVIYEQMRLTGDAMQVLNKGSEMHDNLELEFNRLAVFCNLNSLEMHHIDEMNKMLREVRFLKNDQRPFVNFIRMLFDLECLGDQTVNAVESIADAAEDNPNKKFTNLKALTNYMRASVALKRHQYEQAEQFFMNSFAISKKEYTSMQTAIFEMLRVDEFDRAQRILDHQRRVYEKDFKFKYDWLRVGETIDAIQTIIDTEKNEQETVDNHTSKE